MSSRDRVCGGRSSGLSRHIATPTVAKHRLFVWLDSRIYPDCQLIVIARDDDTTFGILHSRFHEAWSLRLGTSLEDRPRPSRSIPSRTGCRPTSPPPTTRTTRAPSPSPPPRLVSLLDRWLNPPEWVEWVDEPAPGYPKRPVARNEAAGNELKKRTLTNLYNAYPQWLADAHAALDAAVADACGWDAAIFEDDALRELLVLNSPMRGS